MDAALAARKHDIEIIGMVGVAHWFSHFYQLALPPLFPLIRAETGISYTRLGLLMGVFYVTSGLCQTPAGFLVDRFGARTVLLGGLAMLAAAILIYSVAPSYEVMVVLACIGGLGNSVFHPADYSIMSATVSTRRMGRAFSAHSLGGHLGYAAAPAVMIALGTILGWRGALGVVGLAGAVPIAVLLIRMRMEPPSASGAAGVQRDGGSGLAAGVKLLMRAPMVLLFAFFTLMAMALIGLQSFTPTALITLRDMPLATANLALAGFLTGAPAGIIAGGIIADRIVRHDAMATGGLVLCAAMILGIGLLQPAVPGLVVTLFLAGFWFGLALPSRDLLVRSITPPGASGKVFGFVYSGLDTGSAISPVLFGWFVDIGHALWIFLFAPVFLVLSAAVIVGSERVARRRASPAGAK